MDKDESIRAMVKFPEINENSELHAIGNEKGARNDVDAKWSGCYWWAMPLVARVVGPRSKKGTGS